MPGTRWERLDHERQVENQRRATAPHASVEVVPEVVLAQMNTTKSVRNCFMRYTPTGPLRRATGAEYERGDDSVHAARRRKPRPRLHNDLGGSLRKERRNSDGTPHSLGGGLRGVVGKAAARKNGIPLELRLRLLASAGTTEFRWNPAFRDERQQEQPNSDGTRHSMTSVNGNNRMP